MNANKFSRLIDDKRFLFVISFLVAVIMWCYVVVYVSNEHTTVIRNVPINVRYRRSTYQSLGLDVIETDIRTVNVTVTGPRSVTGDLTSDDIIIYPNITGVDGPGMYSFALTAEKTSSVKNFTINSISMDVMHIRLDRLVSREFTVEADISGLVVAGDCIADTPAVNPAVITITGPENKVNSISKVTAATASQQTVSRSVVLPGDIRLYDENDAQLDTGHLTLSENSISITIPVLKEVTLPLKVEYMNVPDGFDTETLHKSLSESEIKLAVPAASASSLTEFVVGYIDLETLQTDEPYVFDIQLPRGYKSMDDLSSVNAVVSSRNLVERVISVSDIRVINDPGGNVEVLTQVISSVVIIGEADVINDMSDGSVIAQVDASKLAAAQGQQSAKVSFIIPSTDKVYVKGTYTATVRS